MFLFVSPTWGFMIQFDDHIFSTGLKQPTTVALLAGSNKVPQKKIAGECLSDWGGVLNSKGFKMR